MLKKFLYILAFLWLLPITIPVWLFYILPLLRKDFKFMGWQDFMLPKFKLISKYSKYAKSWKDWYGWSGPFVILYKDKPETADDDWVKRTLVHEHRHFLQQLILGPFHYPLYGLETLRIYFFCPDKHPYLDNWFERDVRKSAGQLVDVPV